MKLKLHFLLFKPCNALLINPFLFQKRNSRFRVRITLVGAFAIPPKKNRLSCLPFKANKYFARLMSPLWPTATKPALFVDPTPLYTTVTFTQLNNCREAFAKLAGLGGPGQSGSKKTVTVQELFPWSGAESGTGPYNKLRDNLL